MPHTPYPTNTPNTQQVPVFCTRDHGAIASDTCNPLIRAIDRGTISFHGVSNGFYPGEKRPNTLLPGVSSLGVWDAAESQDWGLDWHRNEGIELMFVERGHLDFGVEEHEAKLHRGDMTTTRPWQPHRVGAPNISATRVHWLILDVGVRSPNQPWRWPDWITLAPDDLNQLTRVLRFNEQPVWRATPELTAAWRSIAGLLAKPQTLHRWSQLSVALNSLLLNTLIAFDAQTEHLDESLGSSERTVKMFLNEIRQNDAQRRRPWAVEDMAHECGIGTTHFSNLCRQVSGMTPSQFLTHARVEKAKALLGYAGNPIPINTIAEYLGFTTPRYFTTVFRKATNLSPSEFRDASNA